MSQELLENLKALAKKIAKNKHLITNETQTRTKCVKPFFKILGYDDIEILVPKYIAGFDGKADYVILSKDKPLVIVEIKHHSADLDAKKISNNPIRQLARYFDARAKNGFKFGILTNGLEYRFFADAERQNTMDLTPFMVLNFESNPLDSSLTSEKLAVLELFTKEKLPSNIKKIRNKAKAILDKEWQNDLFEAIKVCLEQEIIFSSRVTNVILRPILVEMDRYKQGILKLNYRNLVVRAFDEIIADKVDKKIAQKEAQNAKSQGDSKKLSEDEIVASYIVRGILLENPKANLQNIVPRRMAKAKYFSMLLDDNKNKWICRLWLNGATKYVELAHPKNKFEIANLNEIYKYKNELLESLKMRLK